MADYPTLPPPPSNPTLRSIPDPLHVQQMLDTLRAIPRAELPDGDDRDCLAWLIAHGFVDNLYKPMGSRTHTIAWAHRPAWRDPREPVAAWLAARRTWDETGELDPARQALARELGQEQGDE